MKGYRVSIFWNFTWFEGYYNFIDFKLHWIMAVRGNFLRWSLHIFVFIFSSTNYEKYFAKFVVVWSISDIEQNLPTFMKWKQSDISRCSCQWNKLWYSIRYSTKPKIFHISQNALILTNSKYEKCCQDTALWLANVRTLHSDWLTSEHCTLIG